MQWIKDIVEGLIEIYNTRDVFQLLERLDITLITKQMPKNIKGRFFRDIFNNEFIFIDENLHPYEEKMVIAHELGHALLHVHLTTSYYTSNKLQVKDKFELQANKFAAELLIDNEIDLAYQNSLSSKELSSRLKVPEELIKLKFRKEL